MTGRGVEVAGGGVEVAGGGDDRGGSTVMYNTMGARPCGLAPIVLYIAPAVEWDIP